MSNRGCTDCDVVYTDQPFQGLNTLPPESTIIANPLRPPGPNPEPTGNSMGQGEQPTLAQATRFWLKLGFISFGGPTAQIAIMHSELVERRKWVDESRFLHALNYCMLLPGPEAQQLAIYIGWLLHRTWGGVIAGSLFVLPSAFLLWALSTVYVLYGKLPWIEAIFMGLKPAVVAIVAAAVIRIGRKALKNSVMWVLALLAFAAIFFARVPFPIIIISAGLIGFFGGKYWAPVFQVASGHGSTPGHAGPISQGVPTHPSHWTVFAGRTVRLIVVCLVLWSAPLLAAGVALGWDSTPVREGLFFSKAAMVTFGGAYAVLPYVAQQAVERFSWLSAPQMLDGLSLAETTPGPLIMVVQFVGFVGAWHHPGSLPPLLAATIGAAITTWVTFVPCFLWILAGAPYIERMRNLPLLNAALSAITAAVVGVVLNLAVWFAIQIFFHADRSVDYYAVIVAIVAFVLLVRFKMDMILLLVLAAAAGCLRLAF